MQITIDLGVFQYVGHHHDIAYILRDGPQPTNLAGQHCCFVHQHVQDIFLHKRLLEVVGKSQDVLTMETVFEIHSHFAARQLCFVI
ncbi:hypothetical protein D3C75_1282140 [compost metagenome]